MRPERELKWVAGVLAAGTIALVVMWRGLDIGGGLAVVAVGAALGLVWLYERRSRRDRPQGISSVLFGLTAQVIAIMPSALLLRLPRGSSFDSFSGWSFDMAFWLLAALVGITLAVRAVWRAPGAWKLLGVAGLGSILYLGYVSHQVWLWVVNARGLEDLW